MRIVLAIAALVSLLVSPLAAGPCRNDNWQPTFVHDLDNEDGPWYVTSGMSFVKLRAEANGSYVPHACELVRGPEDTRDRRGFTNCREYTRIQCGCSRKIPGNRTCAAFLRFHTTTPPVVTPSGGGAGIEGPWRVDRIVKVSTQIWPLGSSPPGSKNTARLVFSNDNGTYVGRWVASPNSDLFAVSAQGMYMVVGHDPKRDAPYNANLVRLQQTGPGTYSGTCLRHRVFDLPEMIWVPCSMTVQGTQATVSGSDPSGTPYTWTLTFLGKPGSRSEVTPPAEPATPTGAEPVKGFQRAPQYVGQVIAQGPAVVVKGGRWTNGQVRNGVRDGNRVLSDRRYNFNNGGDAYMRIVVNGGGKYMAFWPRVLEGVGIKMMSTHHAWNNSIVVADNTPIFAHVHVAPGGAYTLTIATGNYAGQGGRVINSSQGVLSNRQPRLEVQFTDNYAGEAASLVLSEVLVREGSSGGQPPGPQAAGLSGGAPCTHDNQCTSGLCMLGVCSTAR